MSKPSFSEKIKQIPCFFKLHDWEGLGEILRLYEPSWTIYYAERTQFRRCKRCELLQRFTNRGYLSEKQFLAYWEKRFGTISSKEKKWIRGLFTVPKNAKRHSTWNIKTTFEANLSSIHKKPVGTRINEWLVKKSKR